MKSENIHDLLLSGGKKSRLYIWVRLNHLSNNGINMWNVYKIVQIIQRQAMFITLPH